MISLHAGWFRLWLVAAVAFAVIAIWQALNSRDSAPDFATCVPGTVETAYDESLFRLPTANEIASEKKVLLADPEFSGIPPLELDMVSLRFAEHRIQVAARYKECVSVSRLLEHLALALAALVGLIVSSLTARWIVLGFRKKEQ